MAESSLPLVDAKAPSTRQVTDATQLLVKEPDETHKDGVTPTRGHSSSKRTESHVDGAHTAWDAVNLEARPPPNKPTSISQYADNQGMYTPRWP